MSEHEYDFSDGLISGAAIADQMFENIPSCLRVRMGLDSIASAITSEELEAVEAILKDYIDEAFIVERDFDWEAVLG